MRAEYVVLILFIILVVIVILYLVYRNASNITGTFGVSGIPVMLVNAANETETVTVRLISPYRSFDPATNNYSILSLPAGSFEIRENLPTQYFILNKDVNNPDLVSFQSNLNQRFARIIENPDADITLIAFDASAPQSPNRNTNQWFRAILDTTDTTRYTYKFQSLATGRFLAKGVIIPNNSPIYGLDDIAVTPDDYIPLVLAPSGSAGTSFILRSS